MELKTFNVSSRTGAGKNENNRLRAKGMAPGILYGKKKEQVKVQFNPNELAKFLDPSKKRNTYFQISVDGKTPEKVIIREAAIDALTGTILHVDFLRLEPEDKHTVIVPFTIIGKAEGQKLGGKLRQVLRELPVTCKVSEIPEVISFDVTPLKIDTVTRIENLNLPEGLVVNLNPRQAVIMLSGAKTEKNEGEEA